jgi:GTPase SAR1 family protein
MQLPGSSERVDSVLEVSGSDGERSDQDYEGSVHANPAKRAKLSLKEQFDRYKSEHSKQENKRTKLLALLVDDMLTEGPSSLSAYEDNKNVSMQMWFLNHVAKQRFGEFTKLVAQAWDVYSAKVCNMSMYDLLKWWERDMDSYVPKSNTLSVDESLEAIGHIVNCIEGIPYPKAFYEQVYCVGDKSLVKNSAIFLVGGVNCGKTILFDSLVKLFRLYAVANDFGAASALGLPDQNQFAFQDISAVRAALLNECQVSVKNFEVFKNLCEGIDTAVNVKYKSKQIVRKTPLFISANKLLTDNIQTVSKHAIKAQLDERLFTYNLQPTKASSTFFSTRRRSHIHPSAWFKILIPFANIMEPQRTLPGYDFADLSTLENVYEFFVQDPQETQYIVSSPMPICSGSETPQLENSEHDIRRTQETCNGRFGESQGGTQVLATGSSSLQGSDPISEDFHRLLAEYSGETTDSKLRSIENTQGTSRYNTGGATRGRYEGIPDENARLLDEPCDRATEHNQSVRCPSNVGGRN